MFPKLYTVYTAILTVLCGCIPFSSATLQKGNLIGVKAIPVNQHQIVALEQLRNSEDGYLFWGGDIKKGSEIGILIPKGLKTSFWETMTNLSLLPVVAWDPVYMELKEKKEIKIKMDPVIIAQVIALAAQYLAPLTETAVDRLHSSLFGSGRATRSTDVVIFNSANYKFRLGAHHCQTGILTSAMLPDFEIPAQSTSIYGVESHGFMTGVTDCRVQYTAMGPVNVAFEVQTSNPYSGHNHAEVLQNIGVQVQITVGGGNNNIVEIHIF